MSLLRTCLSFAQRTDYEVQTPHQSFMYALLLGPSTMQLYMCKDEDSRKSIKVANVGHVLTQPLLPTDRSCINTIDQI